MHRYVCGPDWLCFARKGKEGYNRGTLCLSCQAPSSDPSTCICILPPKLSHQRQCQAKAIFQLTMIMGYIRTSHSGKPIHKDYWEYGPAAGIFVSTAGVFKFSHCPSFSDQRHPSIWVHHGTSLTFNYCCLPLLTALARQAVKTRFWINGFQSAFIHGGGNRNSALVDHVVCSSVRHASIIQSAHLLNQAVSRECKKIRLWIKFPSTWERSGPCGLIEWSRRWKNLRERSNNNWQILTSDKKWPPIAWEKDTNQVRATSRMAVKSLQLAVCYSSSPVKSR